MVGGDTLVDAQATFQNNEPVVSFKFDSAGARRFGDATRENVGKPLRDRARQQGDQRAGHPRADPRRQRHHLAAASRSQSASDLALLLRAGALPAPITILEERTVGAELGADFDPCRHDRQHRRRRPGHHLHGAVLRAVRRVRRYRAVLQSVPDAGGLSLLGATLTLPGIAGIALTMGMAVDANVLIYERIRRSCAAGARCCPRSKPASRRAFGTILDSHVTTLVAGSAVLARFGPGEGLRRDARIGVLTSLFSAFLVTRLQIVTWLRKRRPSVIPL